MSCNALTLVVQNISSRNEQQHAYEKRYKIFKKKAETDELPDDSTDIFQRNMLDRCIDRPNEHFKNY